MINSIEEDKEKEMVEENRKEMKKNKEDNVDRIEVQEDQEGMIKDMIDKSTNNLKKLS